MFDIQPYSGIYDSMGLSSRHHHGHRHHHRAGNPAESPQPMPGEGEPPLDPISGGSPQPDQGIPATPGGDLVSLSSEASGFAMGISNSQGSGYITQGADGVHLGYHAANGQTVEQTLNANGYDVSFDSPTGQHVEQAWSPDGQLSKLVQQGGSRIFLP
jgi:hypothetical protein